MALHLAVGISGTDIFRLHAGSSSHHYPPTRSELITLEMWSGQIKVSYDCNSNRVYTDEYTYAVYDSSGEAWRQFSMLCNLIGDQATIEEAEDAINGWLVLLQRIGYR